MDLQRHKAIIALDHPKLRRRDLQKSRDCVLARANDRLARVSGVVEKPAASDIVEPIAALCKHHVVRAILDRPVSEFAGMQIEIYYRFERSV